MSQVKIGFVGIGNLGMPMARSLVKKGLPVTVFDLRKERVEMITALGGKSAASLKELAATCDIIFSMVNDLADTDAVINGLWDSLREGTIIVLSSTLGPQYCRKVNERAQKKKVKIVDAAVSKSLVSNVEGELTLMIGGDDDAVKKCWSAFEAIARYNFHVGPTGTGQAFKIVNNLLAIGNGALMAECLDLGLKAGLDLDKMVEVMQVSTGNSWMLQGMGARLKAKKEGIAPKMSASDMPTKDIGAKDKMLAWELARDVGAKLPLTSCIDKLDTTTEYKDYAQKMKS
jgi:3-hydroxyisobutyrate dehydrogenase-like beta-hydroxyacid dehydrogenase